MANGPEGAPDESGPEQDKNRAHAMANAENSLRELA